MMNIEEQIHLNKFQARDYQLPIFDAIENKDYRKVVCILPRRAGKDICAFNIVVRYALRHICVCYYIFPTYSQGRKVIFDSITSSGERILDYIPKSLIAAVNSQEMKIRLTNGSLIQVVGSDNYDCFDDKTELLTDDGWKLFKDLNKTELVATLCGGELKYEKPLAYQVYDYQGDLYCIDNSSMNFMVTPNHRFYVKSNNFKDNYRFKEISDPTIRHDMIPSQCIWKGNEIVEYMGYKTSDFVALLGIFLSEGSTFSNDKCYRITICQVKPHVRELIAQLLGEMGISFCETKNGFNIESKRLYQYFSQFGKQIDRFIPKDIKSLSKDYLHILFEWLILGDGYRCDVYTAYYSISKRLIDDVQELIIKLGLSGNVRIKKQKVSVIKGREIKSCNPLYEIRVRRSEFKRLQGSSASQYIHTVPYAGKVYCVSTTSGVIKVRRNGKEMWSGNSLMGTNPRFVVFSEYALQDPRAYQFIRPILAANGGYALFLSTPRGKNHLYSLYEMARNSDQWFAYKLTLDDTKHIPYSEIEQDRRDGLISEDLIMQEYYTSFECGVEGAYYAKYLDRMKVNQQIGVVPWEPGFKVNTAWDLGVRDSTCIIFFQIIGQQIRLIDCYERSKEGLEHYVNIINNKPYTYGRHIAPFDISVKEFGSGMTRIEKARQLGLKFTIAPNIGIEDGIESVRSAFGKIWIDENSCKPLIKALENYRQEFDSKRQVYKSQPLHDINSHFADCMRYLCVSLPKIRDGLSPEDLERRYQEAVYGDNSRMPSVFRDDLPPY